MLPGNADDYFIDDYCYYYYPQYHSYSYIYFDYYSEYTYSNETQHLFFCLTYLRHYFYYYHSLWYHHCMCGQEAHVDAIVAS